MFKHIKLFVKDKRVASVSPSSRFVVEKICAAIDFNTAKKICELGPADGVITKMLLKKLSADARLIVIEQNRQFAEELKTIADNRLTVVHDNAENLADILSELGIRKIDCCVSGIPFSQKKFILPAVGQKIVTTIFNLLAADGSFIAYQLKSAVYKYMSKSPFRTIEKIREPRNIPPLTIYVARK